MPLVSIWKHLVHTFNYFDMRLVRPITLYMELKQTTTQRQRERGKTKDDT